MLATNFAVLPEAARDRVCDFFVQTQTWIARNITEAKRQGDVLSDIDPEVSAGQFLAMLEGENGHRACS